MITRDNVRELAEFQSPKGDAVTFYWQPVTPQDKTHRHEMIQVKDLVRNVLRDTELSGKNGTVKADLDRILELSERLHGNQGRAKAIFACRSQNLWNEFDLPARLPGSGLIVNSRFHLKPLTALNDVLDRVVIAAVDRSKARIFELYLDEIKEKENFVDDLTRRGRSDGFFGYDAGHAERKVDNDAMNHYKKVSERLLGLCNEGASCSGVIIACHNENWPAFEKSLHPFTKEKLVGRLETDLGSATLEQVRSEAEQLLDHHRQREQRELVQHAVGEAKANNLGAVGLRRVLRSLEMGEVYKLLLERSFSAPGVECRNCGHIDMARAATACAVCGRETVEVDDIADALIGRALRGGAEIVYVPSDPDLQMHGNIAAVLRFRAERSVGERLAS